MWTAALEHYSGGYKDSDPTVRDLIYRLSQLHWNMESSPYSNMGKKFAKVSRHRVSLTGALRADKIRFSVCAPPEEQMKVTEESDMITCDSAAMHSVALSLPISPHESEASVLLESIAHEDDLSQRVVLLSSEDDMDTGHERLSDTCCASDDSLDLHLEAPLTASYQDALNTIPLSLPNPIGCAPTIIVSGSVLAADSAIHVDTKPMDDVTDAADTISAAVGTTESGRSSSALIVDSNRSVNCYADDTKLESKKEFEVEGNLMVPRTEESTLTSICTTGSLNSTDVCQYHSAPATSIKKYWHSPSSSLFMDLILSPCTTTDKSEIPCDGISRDLALELEDTQPPLSIALCAASEQTVHPSVKALMPATRKSTKTICSKSNTHGSGTATEAKAGSETVSVSEELKATVEVEEASSSRYSKRISTRRCK